MKPIYTVNNNCFASECQTFLGTKARVMKQIRVSNVCPMFVTWTSLVAQLVNNPPAMWETWVQSLGWEDPLEKRKATHSNILAWRIPWTV